MSVPESAGIMMAVLIVNITENGEWIMKSGKLQMPALNNERTNNYLQHLAPLEYAVSLILK